MFEISTIYKVIVAVIYCIYVVLCTLLLPKLKDDFKPLLLIVIWLIGPIIGILLFVLISLPLYLLLQWIWGLIISLFI